MEDRFLRASGSDIDERRSRSRVDRLFPSADLRDTSRVSDSRSSSRGFESAAPRSQYVGAGGVVINSPTTYEDVQLLIDHLKMHEQVIVDFSSVNQTSVYRILDFMSGAVYALGGSIQQIAGNIFLFAPSGVTITVPPQLGRR